MNAVVRPPSPVGSASPTTLGSIGTLTRIKTTDLQTRELQIAVIPASAPDFFLEDTPTAALVRQVLEAVAQFEKASTVAKLKAARDRKRARDGKCEGRKSHAELSPEMVAMAKRLRRRNPKTGKRKSLRSIAAELAALGHRNVHGRPFAAESIKAMVQHR